MTPAPEVQWPSCWCIFSSSSASSPLLHHILTLMYKTGVSPDPRRTCRTAEYSDWGSSIRESPHTIVSSDSPRKGSTVPSSQISAYRSLWILQGELPPSPLCPTLTLLIPQSGLPWSPPFPTASLSVTSPAQSSFIVVSGALGNV